ncbi:glycosyltransferase family 10 domain-containing protein [Litorimonas sp. RW-G-Af-16]|uniref:glycosyltransferase family 10 domain-containing protein n=1 Tax=Litorimonas sp. RW-G-Af-16 TaxID=3241168 RepID=UPI00390C506F
MDCGTLAVITVKFLAKTAPNQDPALWSSLIPGGGDRIEDVKFTFDLDARDYDWLVVYEGLPPLDGEKKTNRVERLACPRANTLLITTEPSSIRIDGPQFLRQFGHVLTHKHPDLVRHSGQIRRTPPLRWFYGRPRGGPGRYMTWDDMEEAAPTKNNYLSTVCSTKQMSHTVHAKRLEFVLALRDRLPEMDVFGRGIQPIDEKSEAMDTYRYHIAIENHVEAGHWTEKLADCFLAGCLPFYFGDPNYASAFPAESVIPIDIFDLDKAEAVIRDAIATHQYEKRLPFIMEARRRVLHDYNILSVVADIATAKNKQAPIIAGAEICGRHIFRRKHPFQAVQDALFRARIARHPATSPLQG